MKFSLVIILVFCAGNLMAQKKIIDPTVYKEWPSLGGNPRLSNNGKYVIYLIKNMPAGKQTIVVQATDSRWKKEYIEELKDAEFTSDSKFLFFIKGKDSLMKLTLGTKAEKYICSTPFFSLTRHKYGEWLTYKPNDKSDILVLYDLKTNQKMFFSQVDHWEFGENGTILLLRTVADKKNNRQLMKWADLKSAKLFTIWEGSGPENLVLDDVHQQLAFKSGDSVLYYNPDLNVAIPLSNKSVMEDCLTWGTPLHFSKDGLRLFITLKEKEITRPSDNTVEVWSYSDPVLYPELVFESGTKEYLAVMDLSNHRVIRVQQKDDRELNFPENTDTTVLVKSSPPHPNSWSIKDRILWSLVSTKNGQSRSLDFLEDNLAVSLSPSGKYLVYFDLKTQGFCSYEISKNLTRNLTAGITTSWSDLNRNDLLADSSKGYARGNVVWLKDESAFLVCDRYDIWRLDPLDNKKPVNLTNSYGKKHNMIFNFALQEYENGIYESEQLYLNAFNLTTKENGFYSKRIDATDDPILLSLGAYIFKTNSVYVPGYSDFMPVRAKESDQFIVRRMSATEAPNYYSTKDFQTFIKLSNLHPEKTFNWYTTELYHWKSLDGRMLNGILYKPENFDPDKKYPVIFHYYERKSDALNAYIKPEALCDNCSINIPTYISQGYLVFTPDIYYETGNPMQGTFDAVVSAAKYVSSFSYVDSKRMGVQGCSFGALQTNYLISHTDIFAAAVSASGLSDMVSHYGSIEGGDNSSLNSYYEIGQARMRESLWENPAVYIKNSPIFQAARITTPVLLMHTKRDGVYPFSNAIEFFTGLRRLGKKAWMLVYSQGNHGLLGREANDFGIRMMQFFDHYLKDKPAPVWMLDGISPFRKGSASGIVLDTTGRRPGPGLLTDMERHKIDSIMTRKPVTLLLE